MREVTRNMIRIYCLNKLKYDFMGYEFSDNRELSFHHLIIAKKDCKGMERKGFEIWNGAILVQDRAHEYLHKIECYDRERFEAITKEMIDENVKRHLDMENIRVIDDILRSFEGEYLGVRARNGNEIIKEEYLHRLLLKR
jgi:hypothetical protein